MKKNAFDSSQNTSAPEKWNRSGTEIFVESKTRHPKTHEAFWKTKLQKRTFHWAGQTTEIPEWQVRLQHTGRREWINLRTTNRDTAARRARDLYMALLSRGWDAVLTEWKPKEQKTMTTDAVCSVGEFIAALKASSTIKPKTLEGYCKSFRMIVAHVAGIPSGKERFDYKTGGHQRWLEAVHRISMATLTPAKIQSWKATFLKNAGSDPLAQKTARVSANAFLRNAKALFSPKLLTFLAHLKLPHPPPFQGVAFEKPGSLRYHSTIDPESLLRDARKELAHAYPEQFKVFVLALLVGLRRNEIDKLPWSALKPTHHVIRIEATEFFQPKSEDSTGDVEVDPEVLHILLGYKKATSGPFVIESRNAPRMAATFNHYRAEKEFEALVRWLRTKGVGGRAPLHVLRKEFGSLMNEKFGIYAASRALRHGRLEVTSAYYTDRKSRKTLGLGGLLTEIVPNADLPAS